MRRHGIAYAAIMPVTLEWSPDMHV
jgi:hypothetical protein